MSREPITRWRTLRFVTSGERQRGNESGPTSAAVAANIAARRRELGMTARELADALTAAGRRFTTAAVVKLERNERRVDVDDLTVLSHVLQMKPGALLGAVARGGMTLAQMSDFTKRNPLLQKGLRLAVVENGEPAALVLDYVRNAVETWPKLFAAQREFEDWLARLRRCNDADEAAALLVEEGFTPHSDLPDVFEDRPDFAASVREAMERTRTDV